MDQGSWMVDQSTTKKTNMGQEYELNLTVKAGSSQSLSVAKISQVAVVC